MSTQDGTGLCSNRCVPSEACPIQSLYVRLVSPTQSPTKHPGARSGFTVRTARPANERPVWSLNPDCEPGDVSDAPAVLHGPSDAYTAAYKKVHEHVRNIHARAQDMGKSTKTASCASMRFCQLSPNPTTECTTPTFNPCDTCVHPRRSWCLYISSHQFVYMIYTCKNRIDRST